MNLFELLMTRNEHCSLLACGFSFKHTQLGPGTRAELLNIVRRVNGRPTQCFNSY